MMLNKAFEKVVNPSITIKNSMDINFTNVSQLDIYSEDLKRLLHDMLEINPGTRPNTSALIASPILMGLCIQIPLFLGSISSSDLSYSFVPSKNDFEEKSQTGMQSMMANKSNDSILTRSQTLMPTIAYQQDDIESASKLVDFFIQTDNSFPKLSDQLRVNEQSPCSVSGLSDSDYPSYGLSALPQISTLTKVPLPNELVEQFRHMQCNCMMGLFPAISRAWLTIDGDIFVWNYEDGSDLAYFDGLSETILSVGLIQPKPGIFQSHIEYLLCLSTPVEIVLLGVSFKSIDETTLGGSEMHLLPDPLFSLATDNYHIIAIEGTDDGRIFMGAKDGSLFELIYQAEDGWFSRRCRKVNHSSSSLSFLIPGFLSNAFSENDAITQIILDKSRNILYTRSEKGSIQVYDLEEDGKGMKKVAAISQHNIVQSAVYISRTIDRSNFHPIVHISPVEIAESSVVHLVAITKSGVRLYFTTASLSSNTKDARPYTLQLLHVRLPPGFSSNSPPQRPKNVHKALYKNGTSLMISSQTEDTDVLWTLSKDSFPFQLVLMENQVTSCLDGHTWALSKIPCQSYEMLNTVRPPSVVTQHSALPEKYVFLSAQGSHVIMKFRPVDQLRKLLEDGHGPDGENVKSFFNLHGLVQTCATCLILACSTSVQDVTIAEWATRAFLMYGIQSRFDSGLMPSNIPLTPGPLPGFSSFSESMSAFAPNLASTPQPGYNPPPTPQPSHPASHLSGRHQGLYLYFSRIVRNFWDQPLVCERSMHLPQGTVNYITTSISPDELTSYLESLVTLKDFLVKHFRVTSNIDGSQHFSHHQSRFANTSQQTMLDRTPKMSTGGQVEIEEKKSLLQLQQLIVRMCEVLGLWKIVCDHQIHVLFSSLSKDQQNGMRSTTCHNFIISGVELATVLVNKLISQYLDDNATTDAISVRLREVCPSIYRNEDVDWSKALEKIISAKKVSNVHEKEVLLQESLQLCKKITPQLNLRMVAEQFQSVHFYSGIVDLCLTAALNRDPQNLAVHYYKNGEPVEDQQGMQACFMRAEAYKIITDLLGQLLTSSMSHPQSPSVPKQPGPPPIPDPNMLSPQQASQYAEEVFQLALQSEDELFHYSLYDWLVENKFTERLLQVKSHFLEVYLKRHQQPENLAMLDLLWKYYEKNKCFSAAAKILAKLADRHGTDVNLQLRIEYLSRAVICIKSTEMRTLASIEGEFLHELEEKLEVARIQLQIVDFLQIFPSTFGNVQKAVGQLNSDLYDISQLYEQFAEPFSLFECQLAILHCAGHHDNSLIESLWQKIIDQAFLIRYLEKKSCSNKIDNDWVISMMLALGVTLPTLLEIYDKVYKSKDPCWQVEKKPLHLLEVLVHLITRFVEHPTLVQRNDRRSFTTSCLDAVASYLIDLQSLAGTEASSGILMASFKSLQAKLERLI
ncbi:Nuclear pore complex protein Nup155 [Nymphon striatum]|nr:Nuclear pore complex protein Nup155 [Nymphon striatum]